MRIWSLLIDSLSPRSASVAIAAHDVGKSARGPEGEVHILDNIGMTVHEGESIAIVGASGSGKTTLLGLLAGLDLPSRGRVTLAGSDLNALDEEDRAQLRAREVGFVFQSFHLLPALTAEENIALPLELAGREDPTRVREVLAQVGLTHRARHYPRQLSGGEQQRVNLARGFMVGWPVMLLDEPTASLDEANAGVVLELIGEAKAAGSALIGIFHDRAIREAVADRYLDMTQEDLAHAS